MKYKHKHKINIINTNSSFYYIYLFLLASWACTIKTSAFINDIVQLQYVHITERLQPSHHRHTHRLKSTKTIFVVHCSKKKQRTKRNSIYFLYVLAFMS